jgi:protein-S-isoprenylcysteine O-methyltransferase Ste14
MKNKIMKQAGHEYSPNQRLIFLLLLVPVFLVLLPYLFVFLGQKVDQWLGWPPILNEPLNYMVGVLLIVLGLFFALWSIYGQFTIGRGTPVPLMPTQKLVVQPPFTYCRNPMSLGTIVAYSGVALLFHGRGHGGAAVRDLTAAVVRQRH